MTSERSPMLDGSKSSGMSLMDVIPGGKFCTKISQLMNASPAQCIRGLPSSASGAVTHHVIRQAVAVARLIGVPAPIHVRQVERPDGPQRAAPREEFAD